MIKNNTDDQIPNFDTFSSIKKNENVNSDMLSKNLKVYLPNIDNSYLANHIQEVINPFLDDTSNYSFYNMHNDVNISNDGELSSEYDNINNNYSKIGFHEKNFDNNYYSNKNNNLFYRGDNNSYMNNNILHKNLTNKNTNNIKHGQINIPDAEKKKFQNYNPEIMDNSEFLDFQNQNHPNNNIKNKEKIFNYGMSNMKVNNYNDEYYYHNNQEQIWVDNNIAYQHSNQIINNKIYSPDTMQNNIKNKNNRQIQYQYMMNNISNNNLSNYSKSFEPTIMKKMNQINYFGFNSNCSNLTSMNSQNNLNNINFSNIPIPQPTINPNIILNKNKNNYKKVNFNANKNQKYTNDNPNNNMNFNNRKITQNFPIENLIPNKLINKNINGIGMNNNKMIQVGSPINNKIDNNLIQNLKLNKNIINYTDLSNEELAKNALLISKDQYGCRYIQKKISENSDFSNNFLFSHVF